MVEALFADVLPMATPTSSSSREASFETMRVPDPAFKPLGPLRPVRWLLPHEAAGIVPQVVRAYVPPRPERVPARLLIAAAQRDKHGWDRPRGYDDDEDDLEVATAPVAVPEDAIGVGVDAPCLPGEYRSTPKARSNALTRQQELIRAGLCLNGAKHGSAKFGRRCEHCHWVWKFGYADALAKGLIQERRRAPRREEVRTADIAKFAEERVRLARTAGTKSRKAA